MPRVRWKSVGIVVALAGCTGAGPAVDVETVADGAGTQTQALSACSAAKLASVLAPATSSASSVSLNCNLTLSASDVVTKRLLLRGAAATGVTVNCNGATLNGSNGTVNAGKDMVEVYSRKYQDESSGAWRWERPQNVTVRNCKIIGSVRIWGMGKNGEAADVRASSRQDTGHSSRARNNAPKNVILQDVAITGTGRIPLYLAPGVTYSGLIDSEIKGTSSSTNIYLDAESYRNTIRGNYIHASTDSREVMAVDGSSYNTIINNRFSALGNGGIYLYRNCGEGGTVRHATPRSNTIVNNVFYYSSYSGSNPAIYLGSRNGWRLYCYQDDGFDFGSSASNRDYARYNIVTQNRIYQRSVSDMIVVGNDSADRGNIFGHNQTVTSAPDRKAGCYVPSAVERNFIFHGQSTDLFKDGTGRPQCTGSAISCNDGVQSSFSTSSCSFASVNFSCQVGGSNSGCTKKVGCPSGRHAAGAVAACNLEYGTVSAAQVNGTAGGTLAVVRSSDTVSDGRCFVGGSSAQSGTVTLGSLGGAPSVSVGCKEKDGNGGDCHIRGTLWCR